MSDIYIKKVWTDGGYEAPNIIMGINESSKEKYIVIKDDSSIYRMMNFKGEVYMIAGFKCKVVKDDNGLEYYECTDSFHPISCSSYTNKKDAYGNDNIIPLFK